MTNARRRLVVAAAVGVLVFGILGYAAFEFTGRVRGDATSTVQKATTAPTATAASRATSSPVPTRAASPAATTAAPPTSAPPAQTITAVSAVAFGPNGTADGDDPQIAGRVLTDPAMGWVSQWYATPNFGDLKQGTGLLLDLGRTVTISSVSVNLGSPPGADVQLRLGTAPTPGALKVVASATATGDQLTLPLTTPATARYVLVWFTKLPPDGAGTYQVLLHQVTVQGQP